MKTAKRILTVALALMLIFAMAAPSFAQVPGNLPVYEGDSNYHQTTLSDYYVNGQITVHLHVTTFAMSSTTYIDRVYDVTVGTPNATNQLITVKDVLEKADSDNSNLTFTIQTVWNNRYETYDSTLTAVRDDQVAPYTTFNAKLLYFNSTAYGCGYMFRINGMIPYFTHTDKNNVTTTEGCLINDAYVTAGDTIDLYFTNVYTQLLATRVRYVRQVSNTTFQLLEAECYKPDAQLDWELTEWDTPVVEDDVNIFIDGVDTTVYVDENGQFTLSNLSSGTHTFRYETNYVAYSTSSNGTTYNYVPYEVGMYSEYVVN